MRTLAELDTHLDHVRAAPRDVGTVELIVRRPTAAEREVIAEAELDVTRGLVGDNWLTRGSKRTKDGSANPEQQLTLMSVRAIAAIEADRERWPLAGDQLFVDFDLSAAHLPAGTRITLGEAVLEISATPHAGCDKFTARFGSDATKWVNTGEGRELRLRGVNAKIIRAGIVRRGDSLRRV
jgi:MOSC domain-containing protein YiiM